MNSNAYLLNAEEGVIEGFDFDAGGNLAALINTDGVCVVSKIETNEYLFHSKLDLQHNQGIFV